MRRDLRQPVHVLGQQRLLDEQQTKRLQHLGELLGERAVDRAMELEPREGRNDPRPAAVEAAAVADLPDVLDVERVDTDEAVAERLEHALDRLGPSLEARFAPAERAIVALDADEQPPRRDEEGLDLGDLANHHSSASSPSSAWSEWFAAAAWVPLPAR